MQIIAPDWQEQINTHVKIMVAAEEYAKNFHPVNDPEGFSKATELWEGACLSFLDHIETHFGSPQEFSDFMKNVIVRYAEKRDYPTDVIDEVYGRGFPSKDPIMVATTLHNRYTTNFLSLKDEIDTVTENHARNQKADYMSGPSYEHN